MKYTQLPKMKICNAFADCPSVTIKLNKALYAVKTLFIASLIAIIAFSAFYLNVKHEQSILLEQKMLYETNKANMGQSGAVLDATKNIIKREGKLSDNIAKQYAIWVFDSAVKYAVDPMLILSVIFIESKFDYKAISPTGPIGLMQIASSFHKDKATSAELFDPKKNIQVGTQILKEYTELSSSTIETLLRYNGSLGKPTMYAIKVLSSKAKFEAEIMDAVTVDM